MTDEMDTLTPRVRVRVRRKGQRMTPQERKVAQDAFIKALENTANVRAACLQAGISHAIVYQWQEHDTEFGLRFREANTQANWLIFGEAWRRAMTGEERYVVSRGELVRDKDGKPVTYREKSDRMLELLLKARLSEFREKQQVEMSGTLEVFQGARDALLADLVTLPDASQKQEQESSTGADSV